MIKRTVVAIVLAIATSATLSLHAQRNTLPGLFNGNLADFQGNLDDGFTTAIPIGFDLNFFGVNFDELFINVNGNVTFLAGLGTFDPLGLSSVVTPMLAPFWADVDVRDGNTITYGTDMIGQRKVFGVNWFDVSGFSALSGLSPNDGKKNTFQLVLIDRSDIADGDFDVYYRYDKIEWDVGDATQNNASVTEKGARTGYTNGIDTFFEVPGSGEEGAFLDGGPNSLAAKGTLVLLVRNGQVTPINEAIKDLIRKRIKDAFRQVVRSSSRGLPRRMIRRLGGTGPRMKPRGARPGTKAGDMFSDLELSLGHNISTLDDHRSGSGTDRETVVSLTGKFAGKFNFGINTTHAEQEINSINMEMEARGVDAYLNYPVNDDLTIGCFVNFTDYDIEDATLATAGGPIELGENFSRWSSGISASVGGEVSERLNVGITSMLASTNKRALDRSLDNEDSLLINMIDATTYIGDTGTAMVFAQHFSYLDMEDDFDGNFWVMGVDLSYAPHDAITYSVGVSTTVGDRNYDEFSVQLNVIRGF